MRASKNPLRRPVLGALALALLTGPALSSGCAAGFAPSSQVDGLRVISVAADAPYAAPGEQVKLTLTYGDSRAGAAAPTILWLNGCVDPDGDSYYGCYAQLAGLFQGISDPQKLIETGAVGFGPTFSFTLPDDIISRRPKPAAGNPYYGIAYVFFAACAGKLQIVPPEGTSAAGSFPLGCFNDKGERLGADSFVPGFTQVYAFADGRPNNNPPIDDLTLDGESITGDATTGPKVAHCHVPEDDRLGPPSCGKLDPSRECTSYQISIKVPADVDEVAEVDPSAPQADGQPLRETVWVDYLSDTGDFKSDARLVSDAVTGLQPDLAVEWFPPPDPGPVRIWAVVHDNRGGQTVIERFVVVE
jgi:hypothetical protein